MHFGVLGHPVSHSLSPAMHTAAFRALGIDATYERFDVSPEELPAFIQRVRDEKIGGLSVTIPHKVAIVNLLDEVLDGAQKIGAVNTVFWREGKLVGENTDWIGILIALGHKLSGKNEYTEMQKIMDDAEKHLAGKKIIVLGGAGGAARAVVAAVAANASSVTVLSRDPKTLDAYDAPIQRGALADVGNYACDILVNTTPVGMKGARENESPVPPDYFENHKPLVFDVIYTPEETRLLREAREAGCETLNGVEMFVWQGVAQQSLWNGSRNISEIVIGKMLESVLVELRKQ